MKVNPIVKHPPIPCDVSGDTVSSKCVALLLERYRTALNQANGG